MNAPRWFSTDLAGARGRLVIAILINTLGSGLFVAGGALYFTQGKGFDPVTVGLALAVAGGCSMLVGLPLGILADRIGARRLWVAALAAEGVFTACFIFVDQWWGLIVTLCLAEVAGAASQAARLPVVREVGGERAPRLRAYIRSVVNIGTAGGALAAGSLVAIGTDVAYVLLVAGNVVSFLACAALLLSVPSSARSPRDSRGSGRVLGDRRFLAFVVLNSVTLLQGPFLSFAIPLWIVATTELPVWSGPAAVLVNTILVSVLQVRATRGVDTAIQAGSAARTGSLLLTGAVCGIASIALLPVAAGAVILGLSVVALSLGELRVAAGEFVLTFAFSPAESQGEYGAALGVGQSLAVATGPLAMAWVVSTGRSAAWLPLAACFALAAALYPKVARTPDRMLAAQQ